MKAATAPPKSVGLVASSIASAITSPIGCSPEAFWPLGLSRAERMSAVMLPITLLASGAASFVYLSTIAWAAGSGVTFCVTISLVAVASVTCLDWWSMVRSIFVISRPNDDALVTSLPDMWHTYGWCVCALTITDTRGSSPWAIDWISGPLKFTHRLMSVYSFPV